VSSLAFEDAWTPLERRGTPLTSPVAPQGVARELVSRFDYDPDKGANFDPWILPELPEGWNVGVVVGGSGTGKSTLLNAYFPSKRVEWSSDKTIADHFATADEAAEKFYAVGLSSVPTWLKPYGVLSVGEKFRADLARQLENGAAIDEFTSVVDRTVAMATSRSISGFIRENGITGVVFATCHRDVLPWLQPDWVVDTDSGMYAIRPRECLQQPNLVADVYEVSRGLWSHFLEHHYLTGDISIASKCFVAVIDGRPAAFASAITLPSGTLKNAWRGHRVVTLPDFQGLGLGVRLSDWLGEYFTASGYRYFAKTTHPRMGAYRDASPLWRATSKNHVKRTDTISGENRVAKFSGWQPSQRLSYSHEYKGKIEIVSVE